MVKKIQGNKPADVSGTSGVAPTKAVETGAVSEAGNVGATSEKQKAGRTRRPTRPMTAAEREHLFKLIHEEADKMFGANGLPESHRNIVEGAVQQTIDATIIEDED